MPTRPKSPCPRCRRVRCICVPEEQRPKRKAWQGKRETKQYRRTYVTARERKRRKDTVDAWLRINAFGMRDGKPIAVCPDCHYSRTSWVADHERPVALGGTEDGPLRVHCRACSNKQGAEIGRWLQSQR